MFYANSSSAPFFWLITRRASNEIRFNTSNLYSTLPKVTLQTYPRAAHVGSAHKKHKPYIPQKRHPQNACYPPTQSTSYIFFNTNAHTCTNTLCQDLGSLRRLTNSCAVTFKHVLYRLNLVFRSLLFGRSGYLCARNQMWVENGGRRCFGIRLDFCTFARVAAVHPWSTLGPHFWCGYVCLCVCVRIPGICRLNADI